MSTTKTPTKRAVWLARMRAAGYHDDRRAGTRLLVEARINRPALDAAWTEGVAARAAGVRCTCHECAK